MTDTFAGGVADDLAPFLTAENDPNGDHAIYLGALAAPFEQLFSLAMDQGFPDDGEDYIPGWSVLLDVDAAPAQFLPWLAMFNGTVIPAGTDEATARAIIRDEAGMQRGTPGAIVAAARRNLVGSQSVVLLERTYTDGTADPYYFVLVVRPEELVWNAVPNPSFEHDTVGGAPASWSPSISYNAAGATLTVQTSAGAQSGANAMRVVTTASATEGAEASLSGTFLSGVPYTLSAYMKGSVGGESVALGIGSGSDFVAVNEGLTTGWQRFSVVWTPSADRTGVSVFLQHQPASVVTFFVDAVQVSETSGPIGFVSGDLGGFVWSGTAGASTTLSTGLLTTAVNATKPAGIFWSLVQTDDWTISEMEADYATITLLEAAFASVSALEGHVT